MPSTSRGSTPARVGRTGARFAGAVPAEDAGENPRGTAPRFESVLRGYDRDQVEAFLARQTRETAGLREELVDVRRQLGAVTARARTALTEAIARLEATRHEAHDSIRHLVDVVTGQLAEPSRR